VVRYLGVERNEEFVVSLFVQNEMIVFGEVVMFGCVACVGCSAVVEGVPDPVACLT